MFYVLISMKVVFLGVGDAFDENVPNNSHLIVSDTKLMLDCGLTAPYQLWKHNSDKDFLDAVFISHQHADHFFGIPPMFVRIMSEGREVPPNIICSKDLKDIIRNNMNMGYKGAFDSGKALRFIEAKPGKQVKLNELKLSFVATEHIMPNLAIKVSDGRHSVCYSGDGDFNEKAEKLYRKTDLLIHETYKFEEKIGGHGSIIEVIEMATRNKVKCLALTHINRFERRKRLEEIKEHIKKMDIKVIVPESLEEYSF